AFKCSREDLNDSVPFWCIAAFTQHFAEVREDLRLVVNKDEPGIHAEFLRACCVDCDLRRSHGIEQDQRRTRREQLGLSVCIFATASETVDQGQAKGVLARCCCQDVDIALYVLAQDAMLGEAMCLDRRRYAPNLPPVLLLRHAMV